jgi:hypothetical protein
MIVLPHRPNNLSSSPPHDASESPTVFAAAASDGGERVYAEDRDAPDEGTRGEAGSVGRQEGYGFVGDTSEELAALATQLVLQRQAVATSGADPPPPRERERGETSFLREWVKGDTAMQKL